MGSRSVALWMLAIVGVRVLLLGPRRLAQYARSTWLPIAAAGTVAGVAASANSELALLSGPVLINLALLCVFGASLARQPVIERFARVQVEDLSPDEVAYCRRVTQVWCAFFLCNGLIALALALRGNLEWWAAYTGLVAYGLIGLLLAVEYVYRHWRFRRYLGGAFDPILMRCFPPRVARGMSPEFLAERVADGCLERDLRIPETLACWPGHFPSFPLVPGVVQLAWVMALIEERLGRPALVSSLEGLKFKRPLRAGQQVTLELALQRAPQAFSFKFFAGEKVVASGSIVMVTR
jgi:uncharacterized membrane protein/3-hydroxymyristoyl/3-hydroxydecanoyl-(acyl carrier protein) dehydratase